MKKIITGISVFVTILLSLILAFFYFNNKEVSVNNKVDNNRLKLAIVNEDSGGVLNGKTYKFGDDFTRLLSEDDKRDWTVLSRSIAENRFENGSIDVILYIEENFSEKLVDLDSFNPTKAKIRYKKMNNLDPVKEKNIELYVGDHLNKVNQDIIKMYFASVVNNLDDAKRNVENIVKERSADFNNINENIYKPSYDAKSSIKGLDDRAGMLKDSNEAFEKSQKSFSDSVVSMLDDTGQGLNNRLDDVRGYFDLQEENFTRNLNVANESLENQHQENSLMVEGFNDSVKDVLYDFKDDSSNKESEYKNLDEMIKEYNENISEFKEISEEEAEDLTELKEELDNERNRVSEFYFGSDDIDLDSEDTNLDKLARVSLSEKIENSLKGDAKLPSFYKKMIENSIAGASINKADYDTIFDKLISMGAISEGRKSYYENQLSIISAYNRVNHLDSLSSLPKFDFLNSENNEEKKVQDMNIKVKIPKLEKSSDDTLKDNDTNNEEKEDVSDNQKEEKSKANNREENSTNTEIPNEDESVDKPENPDNMKEANPDVIEKLPNEAKANVVSLATNKTFYAIKTSNENVMPEKTQVRVTGDAYLLNGDITIDDYEMHDLVIRSDKLLKPGRNVINFNIYIGESVIPVEKIVYVEDKESQSLIKEDLDKIFDTLSKIDRTASMIKTIYVDPKNENINFESISSDSIYNMYGNLDIENLSDSLSKENVENFKNSGLELMNKNYELTDSLDKTIENFPKIEDEFLPNSYFEDELLSLNDWYNKALEKLNEEYSKWTDVKAKQLEESRTVTENSKDTLLNDTESSKNLYDSIKTLVDSTNDSSSRISQNYESITSIDDQFNNFKNEVSNIRTNVDSSFNSTNDLIEKQAIDIENNKLYSDNFNKVLKNARSGGRTNNNVISFLSKPVELNKEEKDSGFVKKNSNNLWMVLLAIFSAIISSFVTYWLTKNKNKEKN